MTTMKTLPLLTVLVLTGVTAIASAQTLANQSPQAVAGLRAAAKEAEQNCNIFYDKLRWQQMRTPDQSKAMAAALHLRDAARKFAGATSSERWPRPDWLRYCSERLLDAWVEEERFFPTLEVSPVLRDLWGHVQGSLVALYQTAEPIMGRPVGVALPQALNPAGPKPGPAAR